METQPLNRQKPGSGPGFARIRSKTRKEPAADPQIGPREPDSASEVHPKNLKEKLVQKFSGAPAICMLLLISNC